MELLITVTISTLLILLVKRLFKNKVSAAWQLYIWGILILQLVLFPFADMLPESDFSVKNLIPEQQIQTVFNEGIAPNTYIQEGTNIPAIEDTTPVQNNISQLGDTPAQSQLGYDNQAPARSASMERNLAVKSIWAAGTLIFLIVQAIRYIRCRKEIQKLRRCEDSEIISIFESCKKNCKVQRDIELRYGTGGTMLAGIAKPVICIGDNFAYDELKYVFTHELCHYKNKDILLNVLAVIVTAIFWFNPVMWIAFRTFRRDIEIYCDERAIKLLGEKKEYAKVLLKAAEYKVNFMAVSTALITGEKEVQTRIKRLATFKKPTVIAVILVIIVTLVIAAVCLTEAPGKKDTESVLAGYGMQFDVPSEWLAGMKTIAADENVYQDRKVFFNEKGEVFAEIYFPYNVFTEEEMNRFMCALHTEPAKPLTDERIEEAFSEHFAARGFSEVNGGRDEEAEALLETTVEEKIFTFTALKNDITYNFAVRGASTGTFFTVMYVSGEMASKEEVLTCIMTSRDVMESPMTSSLLITDKIFDGKNLTVEEEKQYISEALNIAFSNLVNADMPVEKKILGYNLSIGGEIEVIRGVTQKPDISLGAYYDEVRWDLIFPSAIAVSVDYELHPYMPEFYMGETKFEDQIAVFVSNNYLKDKNNPRTDETYGDFYFLGFVEQKRIEEYGQDSEILRMLENWYFNLNPMSDGNYYTDYIGDAVNVGNLVMSLPLSEYIDVSDGTFTDKAISIKTDKQPYGLTINYWFDEDIAGVSDDIALTPIDETNQEILSYAYDVNAYLMRRVFMNINTLFGGIGNVDNITINLHVLKDGQYVTYTKEASRV